MATSSPGSSQTLGNPIERARGDARLQSPCSMDDLIEPVAAAQQARLRKMAGAEGQLGGSPAKRARISRADGQARSRRGLLIVLYAETASSIRILRFEQILSTPDLA